MSCLWLRLRLRNCTIVDINRSGRSSLYFNHLMQIRTVHAAAKRQSSGKKGGFSLVDGYINTSTVDYAKRFVINGHLEAEYVKLTRSARAGGSTRAVVRHTEQHKKLLVRDRIKLLTDADFEFFEVGTLAAWKQSLPSAACVTGIIKVGGQFCVLGGSDATIKGGTIYPIGVRKQLRAQEISEQLRLPFIHLIDSGGGFLPLQAEIFPDKNHGGRIFYNEAVMGANGLAQISIVCGSCTAGGAYIPTMCDNAIIVDKIGSVFLGGPPLVKAATGEEVTVENLGGATVHCRDSGCTDYFAQNEYDAFDYVRDIVSTLNVVTDYSHSLSFDHSLQPRYSSLELQGLAGSLQNDRSFVYQVLARILDMSEFMEFRTMYGEGIVCGFGRLAGRVVGIIFAVGSGVDGKSAQKTCQLVQMCDQQNMPIVIFQRTIHDGWSPYNNDDIKCHAQLMAVLANSNCHKIAINVGSCYGSDYFTLCGRSFSPVFYFAWPNSRLSYSMESQTDDPTKSDSVFEAASNMWLDEIISPQNTRKVIIECLKFLPPTTFAQETSSFPLKL